MSNLQISIDPVAGLHVASNNGSLLLDAVYTRTVSGEADPALADLPTTVQETVRTSLDAELHGSFELPDITPSTPIELNFLSANGGVRLRKTVAYGDGRPVSVSLNADEVKAILAQDPLPPPPTRQIDRLGYFVPVGEIPVPFERSTLQIAPITAGGSGWSGLGLDRIFHADRSITSAVQWSGALPAPVRAILWTSVHLAVDGSFSFRLAQGSGDAWMWWLSGPLSAIGVVIDDLSLVRVARMGVALPPFPGAAPTEEQPSRVPTDVTEAEVARNPDIYTEDPGEFCKPFQNPERVLGERSFFVILRAEQPVISAEASVKTDPLHVLTFNPIVATAAMEMAHLAPARAGDAVRPGAILSADTDMTFVRRPLPGAFLDVLRRSNRGRAVLDANNPVQWEGDISRYQATTAARGHIVEFRMRWRSNGYSLGTVAKTLTLAPRQTKRIQKIDWRRSELSRRQETTQLADKVSDSVTRERDYDDAVQANLSEWERGESESSMSAAAGGFGFAAAGFVIGGGGGGSNANSSSSQEGGRRTSASEEQRLRDSIRRFGESLRKLDSVVVNEVTQEETATGTTEVVRNANYGHSLTVIYYQILRHLKVETAVAGVRECLFVPFAITPFTVARAYRWREFIRKALRDPQYAGTIKYLKDVLTNFVNSDVPAGRRSDQPVRYVYGSLFIKLAIERPKDKADGTFDPAAWVLLSSFLGSPAKSIYARLQALAEAERDASFQQYNAPVIAATWVDTLQLEAGGSPVAADFTLATRYQFNGVVRVDFSAAISSGASLTREALSSISVRATKPLAPASVANLESVTFTYQTDQFQRTVTASQGAGDLVVVETGAVELTGATVRSIPDSWERTDVRAQMMSAVQGLIEHLNEHVEYYHKAIWWNMDRDRLFMLIDGFYCPGTSGVSIASVVERDPIAIIGNAIVFRVSAGSFLGIGSIETPQQLLDYYVTHDSPTEPMLISLPTDGLYAQSVMDECLALEEHFGNTDWALNDPDPELGQIAPELLTTRRAEPQATQPTALPQTLINLQNAPEVPAPSGLSGALAAVTTPNAFRDMAGLAGTQANAATAFQTAANLATNFGNQAAALKLADIASKAHDAQTADQKLATVQRAVNKDLVSQEEAQKHASQILESLHAPAAPTRPHEDPTISHAIKAAAGQPGSTIQASTPDGQVSVSLVKPGAGDAAGAAQPPADTSDTGGDEDKPLLKDMGWTDSHGAGTGSIAGPAGISAFSTASQLNPQIAFGSAEHFDLGNRGLQDLIDAWARAGLIAGGAFVEDTDANGDLRYVSDWKVFVPDYSHATAPYGDFPVGSRAHWQWIAPNAHYDSNGHFWTAQTLLNELVAGTAVTLSIGDIVMMSGDIVENFSDYKNAASANWRPGPVNVMKGYERLEPFALTGLRLKMFPTPGVLGTGRLADLHVLERNQDDYAALQNEVRQKHPYWDRTKAVVEFLKAARGPTGCSELLILSRLLRHENTGLGTLLKLAPWITNDDTKRLKTVMDAFDAGLTAAEKARLSWNRLTTNGFDLDVLQLVLSNGYYGALALRNANHFTPGNWNSFETAHQAALKMVDDLVLNPVPRPDLAPIPADAVALTAFGMHFMTDAFSAGHMRVPPPSWDSVAGSCRKSCTTSMGRSACSSRTASARSGAPLAMDLSAAATSSSRTCWRSCLQRLRTRPSTRTCEKSRRRLFRP